MIKDEIKALLDDAENQLLLAKDSVNNGDWNKAQVRLEKVRTAVSLSREKSEVLEGRKRSQEAQDKLNQERAK